jgi:hypothetical protein
MAKTNSKYTEDNFIPIKNIVNGMILLENNQKVTGVKIMPKNIFILDQSTQAIMIDQLSNIYNSIDYEFWLMVADRPVDINVFLSGLQLLYNDTQDPVKRKLITQDINKANMFMNNNVVDTEFYILFKEKNDDVIRKRVTNLINGFAAAGLTSSQTSNADLRMILDNFLNGGKTTTFGAVIS